MKDEWGREVLGTVRPAGLASAAPPLSVPPPITRAPRAAGEPAERFEGGHVLEGERGPRAS